jgi:hypothetical protein
VKAIKQKGLTFEDIGDCDCVPRFQIELPLLLALYPAEVRRLLEHVIEVGDEDILGIVIEIFVIVYLQARTVAECNEQVRLLPEFR